MLSYFNVIIKVERLMVRLQHIKSHYTTHRNINTDHFTEQQA
jgi:hypothetical protein